MKTTRPNVLFITCDELRAFDVGCYGNDVIRTPAMDKLAGEGVIFETAVTNNPVCSPARASMLTGQLGRTSMGSMTNDTLDPCNDQRVQMLDTTLAEVFKQAGYKTAVIGKWHMDPAPELVGFDVSVFPPNVHRNYGQVFIDNGQWSEPIDQFAPDFEAGRVEAYLRDRAADGEPFFLFYNISPPHEPIGPTEMPDKYVTMYDPEAIPLRPNVYVDGELAYDDEWFKMYLIAAYWWRVARTPLWDADERLGYPGQIGELPEDSDICLPTYTLKDLHAAYYGATTLADDLLARALNHLEQLGLAENTLVVFTSDHGDNLGSHGLFNKDCLYEEAIRIPMMFRLPGTLGPVRNTKHIAQLIDLMPTILDLAGLPCPDTVQGRSLAPVMNSAEAALDDNVAFIECDSGILGRCTVGVRTPTHTFGRWLAEDGRTIAEDWALFDLAADPYQQTNLLDSPAHADLIAELHDHVGDLHAALPWLGEHAAL
jgi:arylsulfatase A-like enzyme